MRREALKEAGLKLTTTLRDDGTREVLDSGAQKQRTPDRGRYDLLPPGPLKRLAVHYGRGAVKYGDRNWEKGLPSSWYMESLLRHAFQYLEGDDVEDHLAAVAWNAFAIMFNEEKHSELNDIPSRQASVPNHSRNGGEDQP